MAAGTISDVMIGMVVVLIPIPAVVSIYSNKKSHSVDIPNPISSRQISKLHQLCVKACPSTGNITLEKHISCGTITRISALTRG
jgi:hypothetical protein